MASHPRACRLTIRTGPSPTGSSSPTTYTGRDYYCCTAVLLIKNTDHKYSHAWYHTYVIHDTYTYTPRAVRGNRRNSYLYKSTYPSSFSTQRRWWYPATPKDISGYFEGELFNSRLKLETAEGKIPRKFRGRENARKWRPQKSAEILSRPTSSSVQPQIASREAPSGQLVTATLGRGECIFGVAGGGSIVERRRPVQLLCLYCGRCVSHGVCHVRITATPLYLPPWCFGCVGVFLLLVGGTCVTY